MTPAGARDVCFCRPRGSEMRRRVSRPGMTFPRAFAFSLAKQTGTDVPVILCLNCSADSGTWLTHRAD